MKEQKNVQTFKVLNFNEAYVAPIYKYNNRLNLIEWGEKNNYPIYILDLYNNYGSTLHKSIINKKTKLISGKGFNEVIDPALLAFLKSNMMDYEVKKATLDYELFNSFAFEVVYTNGGEIYSVKHIPIHKLRIGIETDEITVPYVWFSNDWNKYKKEGYYPEAIRRFNPLIKTGKQILMYNEYNPSTDGLYGIPGYSTSLNWIELDYETSKFHLNQVKQGYAPSFILNFSTGIPTEDEQDIYYNYFKKEYASADNAGKIIITYSEGGDQKPELIPIQLNDSDERFVMLMEAMNDKIVQGAEIPPQLVILTPGKLGSTEERAALMLEFQQNYVTPRQEVIEFVVNQILSVQYDEKITLKTFIEQ